MSEKATLTAKNLSIGYPKKSGSYVVAKNINFAINQGDFVAVLGKNGIGKSTLLRTLITENQPLHGELSLFEKPFHHYSSKQLSSLISVVLTDSIPMNQLTVYELVALGRQPYTNWIDSISDADRTSIEKALEVTETFDFSEKKIYELSDGMKQRVLIARALAQDTPIMILDEPTVHLDLYHTVSIFELLQSLVKTFHKTVIISSHQLNLALKFADSFIVMTEDHASFGTKETLLEKGDFNKLFPTDTIRFDTEIAQFIVK